MENVGPITIRQAAAFLGHCRVTLATVIDLADQVPVDSYEVPTAMRDALHLMRPATVFPWSGSRTRRVDLDHTIAYVDPDHGGPPGQTHPGNLGPLTRFAHRIKTHGPGWRHHQPSPGVFLWRTPHGYCAKVDEQGTHPLGHTPDLSEYGIKLPRRAHTPNRALARAPFRCTDRRSRLTTRSDNTHPTRTSSRCSTD
jgi:hypothetical protein